MTEAATNSLVKPVTKNPQNRLYSLVHLPSVWPSGYARVDSLQIEGEIVST